MAEFEVKYRINAVIGIIVDAQNAEEAIGEAKKNLDKGIFRKEIDYIDGTEIEMGYDNLDLWNTEIK